MGCLVGIAIATPQLSAAELVDVIFGEDTTDDYFIKFYSPKCGWCKSMAEQWEEFAEMVESEDLDLKVVSADVLEIDTSEFPQLKQVMPGPLPGVFFFPAKTNYYYNFLEQEAAAMWKNFLNLL